MDAPPDQPNGYEPPPPGPPEDWEARRRTVRNLWTLRWVLMGLSALVAIALIASGAILLGLLLVAVVVVRLAIMVMWWRRRRDLRARRGWPGPGAN
jgi:Flp pilus assembly protein TadB